MKTVLRLSFMVIAFSAACVFGMGRSDASKKKTEEAVKPQPVAPVVAKPAEIQPVETSKPAVPAEAPRPVIPTPRPAETVKPAEPIKDTVIARVNGIEIRRMALEKVVEQRAKMQLAQLGPMGAQLPPSALENMKQRLRAQGAEMLIDKELAEQQIKAKKIQTTDEQIDVRLEEIAKGRGKTIKELEGEMAAISVNMDEFRKEIRLSMGLDKLLEMEMSDAEKTVTDEEAKKFYDDNLPQFSQPEQVQASHILLGSKDMDDTAKAAAKAKADEVLKLVKAGGDFAALAKEHSTCPSKERGGDLGYFPKEQMVPEFSSAAFAMKIGDISEIVETQFGYHIIKVTGRKEAETRKFDEVKEMIVANQKNRKRQEFWNTYRTKMREAAKIEKLEEFKVEEPPTMGAAPGSAPKTVTIPPKSAEGETK